MTKKTRRVFSAEFKLECVKLVTEHNHSVQEAAQAINVSLYGLGKWVKQYKDEQTGKVAPGSAISPELVEIQKLKKEIAKLKLHNEILKKASALLMIDTLNNS
ncbi:transposase [Thorsellia anophelis]|uniref:Transposase n=1 Tax=Thorsellia anophelis DSM 18579 TaxID=1123402 RepID=A0A1I0C235_9GAMM|nr:transposase [Thorsellia anophelis]SET13446.1 transposase [Thorsellia anophelis DSM 18579]